MHALDYPPEVNTQMKPQIGAAGCLSAAFSAPEFLAA